MNKSEDIKNTISDIVGIENTAGWEIVDSDPDHNLYLIHHRPEANLSRYGHIRGIVVDTDAKAVICRSFPRTPRIVMDKIEKGKNGKIHLLDEFKTEHVLDPERIRMKTGFEGTIMHVFKHGGKVYRTTRKRLDLSRSRWGNSKYFTDIYWELGGPSDDDLFDPLSEYSPYCHSFILVHPDLLVSTKDNVGEGYLVYLGPKQMWSVEADVSPFKQTDEFGEPITKEFQKDSRPNAGWIDHTLHIPDTILDINQNTTYQTGSFIFAPENLNIEEANKHLKFGFYPSFENSDRLDERLLPGEFIIIEELDDNNAVKNMYRVESPSYAWRSDTRDNDPNLLHRFYELINASYLRYDTPEGKARYKQLFPILTQYDKESVKTNLENMGIYVVWPQDIQNPEPDLNTRESRLHNIWQNFLLAIPVHRQYEAINYSDHLNNKRHELINWLYMINNSELDSTLYSRRVIQIINPAREFAKRAIHQGKDFKYGKKLNFKQLTQENIKNFIYKEEGSSLYRLIREMEKIKKEQNR